MLGEPMYCLSFAGEKSITTPGGSIANAVDEESNASKIARSLIGLIEKISHRRAKARGRRQPPGGTALPGDSCPPLAGLLRRSREDVMHHAAMHVGEAEVAAAVM